MRSRTWKNGLLVVAAICLAGLPGRAKSFSQQSGSDPVADAARKAREDKKTAPKPKKVYTDDDVKPAASSSSPPVGGTTAGTGATAQQKADDGTATEDPNGEKAWRKRFRDQNSRLAKAELELDVLQREVQKSQIEYYPDPQKALSEQNTRKEINEKTAKIEAKKQEIVQLKQGLEDLEEQLRKSGGDPGWAR